MQNILSFKEFYLRILEENFIVIDEISSFDSLFTNIGYIVSFVFSPIFCPFGHYGRGKLSGRRVR